uniref:Neural cell adhesion molecule L1-like protein n=1 Tax=Varanus komodoensis TaxID=61221 RepID=A0A8D2Q9L2_VARKO
WSLHLLPDDKHIYLGKITILQQKNSITQALLCVNDRTFGLFLCLLSKVFMKNSSLFSFKWTKDGKPFDLLGHSRIIASNNSGTFVIKNRGNITVFQGKYHCYASNDLGTTMSDEIELVVPGIPKFPKEKIDPIDVEHGDAMVLHCNPPKGIPPLHIYWMNIDLQHIPQDERVSMSLKGDLFFANVEENDSRSDYCCFAAFPRLRTIVQKMPMTLTVTRSLKLLFTHFAANLIKERRPKLLIPESAGHSSEATVLKGEDVFLECIAEGLPTPHLSWRRVDRGRPNRGAVENYGKILKIEQVTADDAGTYECIARNDLGEAKHEFTVGVEEPPTWVLKPKGGVFSKGGSFVLLCQAIGNPEPTMKWKRNGIVFGGKMSVSSIHRHCLLYLLSFSFLESIVEFEENQWEPGKWQELIRIPGNDTTVVLPLVPYVKYQFRVISVNIVGRSQPSELSERYETPPAAPDKNPENIRVEASKPHEMNMTWEPLKPMEHNGPGLEYKVNWRQQDVAEWEEETVQKHFLVLQNTPTFVPYDIKVQAVNNFGSGPEPNIITGYSSEDIPEAAPSNVIAHVINSTLAKAIWSTIPKDRVRGHLRGYKVSWWKVRSRLDGKSHHPEKHSLTFSADRNDGMIPGLEPFSEYHLTVLAFNSKGAGPESLAYEFQTPEGVPDKPYFLKILNFDKDSVTLSWGPPKKPNGIVTGYILQYQRINETNDIGPLHEINITNPSSFSFRLSNLSISTKYKFYARACTIEGCGKPITEEGITVTKGSKLKVGLNGISTQPLEALEPGTAYTVRLMTKHWVDNNSISADVIETRGRAYAGIYEKISTQGWFIGLMGAIALLTLLLLTVCFIKRNKGGKYSVKEKEDLHPDPEGQSIKDEIFGEYSDSDEKPLKGSLRSLGMDIKAAESADSLVDYGDGEHRISMNDSFQITIFIFTSHQISYKSEVGCRKVQDVINIKSWVFGNSSFSSRHRHFHSIKR